MNSWRIKTIFDNRSQKSLPSAGTGLGATVVRSTRGPEDPVYFSKGETARILNIFGQPTPSNPELLEAIEYNKSYPILISSPSERGLSGGFLVGAEGTKIVSAGINTSNLKNVTLTQRLYKDENSFTGVLTTPENIRVDDQTNALINFKLLLNGDELTLSITEDSGIYTFTGSDVSSGIFTIGDGEITLEISTPITASDILEVVYEADYSDYLGLFILKGSSDTPFLRVKNVGSVVKDDPAFELNVQLKNVKGQYTDIVESPITYSFDPNHEDGYGKNIFVENILRHSDYFKIVTTGSNVSLTDLEYEDDTDYHEITGGFRGIAFGSTELSDGYSKFTSYRKYPVDIFFDATANDGVAAIYSNLRENQYPYTRFILPTPNQSVSETLVWKMPVSNRGISYYYGYFYLKNLYHSAGQLIGIPIGEVAKKHADIMLSAFGGIAPAWYDENNLGGQLTGGRVIESIYDPDESQLKLLDDARINPIVLDPTAGPMIVSRRTSVSGSLSDWSFIDYSGAMDYILSNLTTQVLPYQIVKMNDTSHRTIVRSKTLSVLQPMTVAPTNVVREFAVKCDGENNNDDVLEREEFRLDVAVKFTPKSRTIILTFINTPQGARVEEMFE